jgi:hypothetical protein
VLNKIKEINLHGASEVLFKKTASESMEMCGSKEGENALKSQ